jgi:hypothetical protein
VDSAEAAAAAAVTDFRALGYQASAAAAAAAAGWHVSGYQAALAVLEDMAAAGVTPGVDTYTLFIHHMVQVRRCCGWEHDSAGDPLRKKICAERFCGDGGEERWPGQQALSGRMRVPSL